MNRPQLTHEALEDQKAKVKKLRQLDMAIEKTPKDDKGALQRYYLEAQKQSIRKTFPKPTLVPQE